MNMWEFLGLMLLFIVFNNDLSSKESIIIGIIGIIFLIGIGEYMKEVKD